MASKAYNKGFLKYGFSFRFLKISKEILTPNQIQFKNKITVDTRLNELYNVAGNWESTRNYYQRKHLG